MTQTELAVAAGVSPGRVSDYERGKLDPSCNMMLRLLAPTGKALTLVDADDAGCREDHFGRPKPR